MSLMGIRLTDDGRGYDVPGVGVVPRLSTLLDLLEHPRKREALTRWSERCIVQGMTDLAERYGVGDQWVATGPTWSTDEPTTAEWDSLVQLAAHVGGRHAAADDGTEAHDRIAANLREPEAFPWPPLVEAAIDAAMVAGLFDARAVVETPVYIPQLGVAGTPDLVLLHDDDTFTIIDWKCGKPATTRWRRQLLAYAAPYEDQGYRLRNLLVVRLDLMAGTAQTVICQQSDYASDWQALDSAATTLRFATASGDTTQVEETP